MSNLSIWFLLVGSNGQPYRQVDVTKVSLSTCADVDDFKNAVKAKCPNTLASVASSQLRVFKNKSAFDDGEDPLEEDSIVTHLGHPHQVLIVVVPPHSSQ